MDNVWEQEKLDARKLLDAKRGDESHLSSARFVGRRYLKGKPCVLFRTSKAATIFSFLLSGMCHRFPLQGSEDSSNCF